MKKNEIQIIDIIEHKIHIIKDQKVMFDFDLASLYGVETKVLNQAVKRNTDRFPEDFMFQLEDEELPNLRSQIVTSSYGGRRYTVYAFTEQGIAMLSSVLRSPQAIQVNIQIMRTFTKLRQMLMNYIELKDKIEELELKYDENFKVIFDAVRFMLIEEEKPKETIGFKV
jgi:hypothetical protein